MATRKYQYRLWQQINAEQILAHSFSLGSNTLTSPQISFQFFIQSDLINTLCDADYKFKYTKK